jgi:hypothetical protein
VARLRWWVLSGAAVLVLALRGADASAAEWPDSTRVDTAQVDTTVAARSPRGAMLRSMALPGWGQFYNRKYIKGGLFAAAEIGSAVAYFVRRDQIDRETPPGEARARNVYFFTTIGMVLFSMGDAYVDAHLDAVDWGEIDIGATERGMEARLKVRW